MRSAAHVHVSGRVQGVGFRYFARGAAREQRVTGWARNLEDGRVEVWAEGEEGDLGVFLARLRRGPPLASVEALAIARVDPLGHARFEVLRG